MRPRTSRTTTSPTMMPNSVSTGGWRGPSRQGRFKRVARGRGERAGEIQAVREELRDRFGPLPPDAERLLLVAELRALGAQLGLETIHIKGDEARLTFRRDAAPRLAGLQVTLEAVQFEADVRRAVPLSLRLRRLGGESIGPGLVRALTAVLRDHHR